MAITMAFSLVSNLAVLETSEIPKYDRIAMLSLFRFPAVAFPCYSIHLHRKI
jgi:hypothetical protein